MSSRSGAALTNASLAALGGGAWAAGRIRIAGRTPLNLAYRPPWRTRREAPLVTQLLIADPSVAPRFVPTV